MKNPIKTFHHTMIMCDDKEWQNGQAENDIIEVYGREHGVPHFHLRWPEGRASINIETLDIIIGNPPATILAEARVWAKENRERILAEWFELKLSRVGNSLLSASCVRDEVESSVTTSDTPCGLPAILY